MAKAICSECGCSIEYTKGEDFAYCPMCENDQVEIKLSFDTILFNNLFKDTKKVLPKGFKCGVIGEKKDVKN